MNTTTIAKEDTRILTNLPTDATAREEEKKPKLDYDPFDLRIQVMRFTNPLAVKILVFSIVYHPFAIDGQDWPMLKTRNLDELLAQLFEKYPTLTELEDILYDTAKSLQDSERYLEPAEAIMQSIRPFYEGGGLI